MADRADSAWIRVLIGGTTTIVLATTDDDKPWVVPLEYMADDDLNFY
jgi:nitroimidazol reductase NimA-like FMN-containing flavoprotein (pyridoxamine 5'-phosphate oxidase superfamily)